jgi:hypothetical protein
VAEAKNMLAEIAKITPEAYGMERTVTTGYLKTRIERDWSAKNRS